jgi:amino acid permease
MDLLEFQSIIDRIDSFLKKWFIKLFNINSLNKYELFGLYLIFIFIGLTFFNLIHSMSKYIFIIGITLYFSYKIKEKHIADLQEIEKEKKQKEKEKEAEEEERKKREENENNYTILFNNIYQNYDIGRKHVIDISNKLIHNN